MTEQVPVESILAADIGSTLTHVCLLDRVEGSYRFVARAEVPTTLTQPEDDVTIGLRRAIRRLEQLAQRPLLDEEEEVITPERETGEGVDGLLVTSNAALPLATVLVGLTDDLSLDSARRACSANHAVVAHTVSLGQRARRWSSDLLMSLRQSPPDVILLVGGVDNGPVEPLESAARVLATVYEDMAQERRPRVVFAGNLEARRKVADILAPLFDYRVVDNVRPNVYTESTGELQRELAAIYAQVKLATLPGYRRLRQWCSFPIVSTAEALGTTLRFLARRNDLPQGVLGVDLGGSTTFVGAARGELYQWVLGSALGTGQGIEGVMHASTVEDINRWLPVAMSRPEIVSRLENARLRPHGIPQSMEDLLLSHAIMRQALLTGMRQMRRQHWYTSASETTAITPSFDLIAVRGGSVVHTPQDGLIALTLLDALQPTGLTRLVLDWASIWPQLGALAQIMPLAAAEVLERDSFRELGTLVAPVGEAREGERALSLRIVHEDGSVTEADVPSGTIQRFPLGLNEQVTLEVRPNRALDIGLGRKGLGGKAVVRGGSLGIVVDTRGRPLSLPQDPKRCRAKLQEWLRNLIHDADSPA
jgi:hypothetical protein